MLLDGTASYLADQLGASPDQIKVILLLVGSVPLSLAFPYFPPSTRSSLVHLYALLPSILFLCFVLDLRWGFLELFADTISTWVICKVGVAGKWGRAMPWTVFTVAMGHLAVNHIIAFTTDIPAEIITITGSQMVHCMKLISFAWSIYDGTRPEAELDATQKSSKIEGVPGLLPFLGYSFFFPSILAGPAVTYRSWVSFTTHGLFAKENPGAADTKPDPTIIPAGRKRKALKRFATGIFFLGLFSFYGGAFGVHKLLDPEWLKGKTFWDKFLQMNKGGFIARTKYYAVWCIAESAFILSGLGYNPATKHYDASRNVRIRSIELAPNFKVLLDSWNMNTNVWLRECIYKRVAKKGRKPGFKSTQITFITSALWHGVNPCYLMTFVLGGFCQAVNRSLRAGLRPFFLPPGATSNPSPTAATTPKPSVQVESKNDGKVAVPAKVKVAPPPQTVAKTLYDIGGIVVTGVVLNFAVVPFLLLDVRSSLAAWRAVHFYGLYLVFIPFLLLNTFGGLRYLKALQRKRDAKVQGRTVGKEEAEQERKRLEWEQEEEKKRVRRGEGVPSLGLDVEGMVEEEEKRNGRAKKEL